MAKKGAKIKPFDERKFTIRFGATGKQLKKLGCKETDDQFQMRDKVVEKLKLK